MSSKAMSLKARIRNLAREKRISAQVLLQNYMFESFLMRLSQSEYQDKFILKGGMLIAAIVGLDNRSTMDLDATLKDLPMTEVAIRSAITSICSIFIGDDISYSIGSIEVIRPDDVYGGYRVRLDATFDTISVPLSVDISTGDVITPAPVRYTFRGIFDDEKEIELWAYNTETIIAEKLETVLRRNTLNTRARDFYDIAVFASRQSHNPQVLKDALYATANHRKTTEQIAGVDKILNAISESQELKVMWQKYQKQFEYASDITWDQVMRYLADLCAEIRV